MFTEHYFDYDWYWAMTLTTLSGKRYAAKMFRYQRYRDTRKRITIIDRIKMKRSLKERI